MGSCNCCEPQPQPIQLSVDSYYDERKCTYWAYADLIDLNRNDRAFDDTLTPYETPCPQRQTRYWTKSLNKIYDCTGYDGVDKTIIYSGSGKTTATITHSGDCGITQTSIYIGTVTVTNKNSHDPNNIVTETTTYVGNGTVIDVTPQSGSPYTTTSWPNGISRDVYHYKVTNYPDYYDEEFNPRYAEDSGTMIYQYKWENPLGQSKALEGEELANAALLNPDKLTGNMKTNRFVTSPYSPLYDDRGCDDQESGVWGFGGESCDVFIAVSESGVLSKWMRVKIRYRFIRDNPPDDYVEPDWIYQTIIWDRTSEQVPSTPYPDSYSKEHAFSIKFSDAPDYDLYNARENEDSQLIIEIYKVQSYKGAKFTSI